MKKELNKIFSQIGCRLRTAKPSDASVLNDALLYTYASGDFLSVLENMRTEKTPDFSDFTALG
ncbi:MAG: hypothetical protein GY874_14090 [Desulfobacteraceae bacterium]|nr:hypothetical protein [Desulfobacteraceae bacterium]